MLVAGESAWSCRQQAHAPLFRSCPLFALTLGPAVEGGAYRDIREDWMPSDRPRAVLSRRPAGTRDHDQRGGEAKAGACGPGTVVSRVRHEKKCTHVLDETRGRNIREEARDKLHSNCTKPPTATKRLITLFCVSSWRLTWARCTC